MIPLKGPTRSSRQSILILLVPRNIKKSRVSLDTKHHSVGTGVLCKGLTLPKGPKRSEATRGGIGGRVEAGAAKAANKAGGRGRREGKRSVGKGKERSDPFFRRRGGSRASGAEEIFDSVKN